MNFLVNFRVLLFLGGFLRIELISDGCQRYRAMLNLISMINNFCIFKYIVIRNEGRFLERKRALSNEQLVCESPFIVKLSPFH